MTARPPRDLAADVREASAALADFAETGGCDSVGADDLRAEILGAVEQLVARLETAEAENERMAMAGGSYMERSLAAEAQVAALTQERDEYARRLQYVRDARAEAEIERQRLTEDVDRAWIGSQIALCEEFIRAAKNDETFGVEDIEAKLILLTQATA